MTESLTVKEQRLPDPHQDTYSMTIFGFWVYLMTDCIIFATLFTTYGVMHHATFGGPSSRDLFDLSTALAETGALLASSFTCGLGLLAAKQSKKNPVLLWFAISFLLGATFIALELTEFRGFVREGNSWDRSAFLSAFFTLVGTHGFHVSVGLLWMAVLMAQIAIKDVTVTTFRRLVCFNMFWHFLDLVWIFIFTFVYLFGVIV